MTERSSESSSALRAELRDLYEDYAVCLDEMDLDGWCGFFADDCTYKVISHENHSEGLPTARVTVDAGAHMLSVMALWDARQARDVLISRGLATMAFALPAAIGAALADPDRPVIAFTGDGGLMMCTAELATVAQLGCKLTVVVFNDSSIAMIGVKQRQRQLAAEGMAYSPTDFAAVARGFGCRGYRVESAADLAPRLAEAMRGPGPAVVDVVTDAEPYHEQIKAVRG